MATALRALTIGLCLSLTACGGDEAPAPAATPSAKPAQAPSGAAGAAAIANALAANPDKADAIFAEHGTTQAAFDKQMFEIAKDPALTAAYLAARK